MGLPAGQEGPLGGPPHALVTQHILGGQHHCPSTYAKVPILLHPSCPTAPCWGSSPLHIPLPIEVGTGWEQWGPHGGLWVPCRGAQHSPLHRPHVTQLHHEPGGPAHPTASAPPHGPSAAQAASAWCWHWPCQRCTGLQGNAEHTSCAVPAALQQHRLPRWLLTETNELPAPATAFTPHC